MDFKCLMNFKRESGIICRQRQGAPRVQREEKKEAAVGSVGVQDPTQLEHDVPPCSGGGKAPSPS